MLFNTKEEQKIQTEIDKVVALISLFALCALSLSLFCLNGFIFIDGGGGQEEDRH